MNLLPAIVVALLLTTMPTFAEEKTLSNATLNDKGYQRLDGDSQFRLGCRYLIRTADRATVYRPTVGRGRSISFSHAGIAFRVTAEDKKTLLGTDGSETEVTTWRTCAVL